MATEGFVRTKFCELILRDRNRLSKENALTISDYIIAMKREVNPRLNYKKSTIHIIAELSKTIGIAKKFIDMTRDDLLSYLDKCRKPDNEDPLHKWIGSYNTKLVVLSRFFKWLHYPNSDNPKRRNGLLSYLAWFSTESSNLSLGEQRIIALLLWGVALFLLISEPRRIRKRKHFTQLVKREVIHKQKTDVQLAKEN
jgi:hypothetical protein